jgi:hypothetical protein
MAERHICVYELVHEKAIDFSRTKSLANHLVMWRAFSCTRTHRAGPSPGLWTHVSARLRWLDQVLPSGIGEDLICRRPGHCAYMISFKASPRLLEVCCSIKVAEYKSGSIHHLMKIEFTLYFATSTSGRITLCLRPN